MSDINELRRLTQGATPGPWRVYEVGVGFEIAAGDNVIAQAQSIPNDTTHHTSRKANAEYISAANPTAVSELLDRLEAAEKECNALRAENEALSKNLRGKHATAGATYAHLIAERDALRAALRHEADCVEAAKAEIAALRAKIERMGRQEPVGKFIQHPSHGMWEQDGYGDNPDAKPLYALPGAQLAPNIPPRIEPNGMYDGNHHYASGWNDCRAAMLEAQPEAKP